MQVRPVRRPDDVEALEALFELVVECDGHAPIGEHKYLDLIHAHPDRQTGLVISEGDDLVGYVAIAEWPEDATGTIEMAIHPLHRSPDLIRSALDAAVEEVAALGARRVRMWAFQPNIVEVLEAADFVPERELRLLRVSLPIGHTVDLAADETIESFRPGVDDADWLELNNAAFDGHPENGRWTQRILDDRKRQDWFDPVGFRVLWLRDDMAAFCWTKEHGQAGEIYVVAVAPRFQGRGYGRLMVLEGLRHIHQAMGARSGILYVDADNRDAIRLYEGLGFRLDHVDRSLVRDL